MAKSDKGAVKAGDTITVGGHEVGVVVAVDPVTGCVVCGQNTGSFVEVAGAARAHAECAASHPHVIRKVKARA